MKKNIFKALLPPIFIILIDSLKRRTFGYNILFDGDDALFKEELIDIKIYGEYGCGQSTKWVLENTSAKVISVDTSLEWIYRVSKQNIEFGHRVRLHHVDLGELGDWGRPLSYAMSQFFSDYTDFIWKLPQKPQLVLIDGRFRVCCFLSTLKLAPAGTRVIFDDYINRPHYHFVEKYSARVRECGRQCLFIVPEKDAIDQDELEKDIYAFRNVMD